MPQHSLAGDDTNAANIAATGFATWGGFATSGMFQVMGGTSMKAPGSSSIRGPAGIYAIVKLDDRITDATMAVKSGKPGTPATLDAALTTYYGYLLENPAVSGLLLLARWQDLSPGDPGPDYKHPRPRRACAQFGR
jgi:hypothetical protein